MEKHRWKDIEREDVLTAIDIFLSENPNYPAPRSTFLIYDGKKLPAKHIRGMAYKVAFGRDISKNEYAGGIETVRFFKNLGFEVSYTGKAGTMPEANTGIKQTSQEQKSCLDAENKQEAVAAGSSIKPEAEKWAPQEQAIKITPKGVIEQKNALQIHLNRLFDGDVVCEKTFQWMKTPDKIDGEFSNVYNALQQYRGDTSFAKKNVTLRCDFVIESQHLIIEYDERQHFTEARRLSLLSYPNVSVCYDRAKWIAACESIHAKDNQPANRDEIRAYYDSVRDICAAEHGYRLVRIMHGQTDFSSDGSIETVKCLLGLQTKQTPQEQKPKLPKKHPLRVGLYLQTNEAKNIISFKLDMGIVKKSNADIFVFPEVCYTPFTKKIERGDIKNEKDYAVFRDHCIKLSESIKKPVVVSSQDKNGLIFSLYANALASGAETREQLYIKHTMTDYSAFDLPNYPEVARDCFQPILLGEYRIGMTICYDCNHALFSRIYGLKDVDAIINSTGGNVVFDKWYKYNQVRAIENSCYTFVTMGGDGSGSNPNSYVFGFSPTGKEVIPTCLIGNDRPQHNISGGVYIFDTSTDNGEDGVDVSINQAKTPNKKSSFEISCANPKSVLNEAEKLSESIYLLPQEQSNVIICYVDGLDILKPEKVLALLYAKEIADIPRKKYIIYNEHGYVDDSFFQSKLSVVLKVRAMENFCAVIYDAKETKNCYQTGKNRTAQIVEPTDGLFKIDLERAGGPEVVWKNKQGMRESWRPNFEWLINHANVL